MPLSPGTLIQGRYLIQSPLGQGGMGTVYRALDQMLNRLVAIKERTPHPSAPPQVLSQLRDQFQREAQVLANLNHRSLARVSDFFSWGGNEYLVMDLIDGESLKDIAERCGKIDEPTVRRWADQALDALIYLHANNIIHRDLKPANIILKRDQTIVLVDFGLVKLLNNRNLSTISAIRGMGTPGYSPPEQFALGMHTDARSDIYSLGATLYHLLSGSEPLDSAYRAATPQGQSLFSQGKARVSPQMQEVVTKAMELQPRQRYPNAVEMKQALNQSWPPKSEFDWESLLAFAVRVFLIMTITGLVFLPSPSLMTVISAIPNWVGVGCAAPSSVPTASRVIQSITMSKSVYSPTETFRAIVQVQSKPSASKVEAMWYAENLGFPRPCNMPLLPKPQVSDDLDFRLPPPNPQWLPGKYRVEIFVDGQPDTSTGFSVK